MALKKELSNSRRLQKSNALIIMDYSPAHVEEKQTTELAECVPYKDKKSVTWINIDNVPPADFLRALGLGFDLHPVILQDILTVNQRPKAELADDYVYIVLKMIYVMGKEKKITEEQVSLIIAQKFVISTQQGVAGDVFDSVRSAVRYEKSTTRHSGTDYLGYKLLDAIINGYFGVLELYGEKMEALEDEMLRDSKKKTLHALHHLKRGVLDLRKAVWPLREVISSLQRGDSPVIKKSTQIYLRDVYERVIQIIDTIETQREILTGLLDVYLSSASNKLNSAVKALTMVATVFMPLSFLAGVYGMNFRYMPGLESRFGFLVMAAVMMWVFVGMMVYFWRKRWL